MILQRQWTRLVSCFVLFHCLALADHSSSSNSRRKRYLAFPNKAAIMLTASLLKAIANDVKVGPTVKVVTIHELDVVFPLPHDPSPYELTSTAFGQTPVFVQQAKARHRRDIYRQLEDLFYLHGHNGKQCVLKALCEAKKLPMAAEENLVLDLMSVLFSWPQNVTGILEDEYHVEEKDCINYEKQCLFSVFDLAFGWAEKFSTMQSAQV